MNLEETRKRIDKLQQAIRDLQVCYGDQTIRVTMTFGMGQSAPGESYEKVIKRADEKLYVGKNGGRDQIVM